MCSVRQSPMPSAPKSRARLASSGVSALVRIAQLAILVGPLHDLGEIAGQLGSLRGDFTRHHLAGRTVDREHVVVGEGLASRR